MAAVQLPGTERLDLYGRCAVGPARLQLQPRADTQDERALAADPMIMVGGRAEDVASAQGFPSSALNSSL